MSFNVIKLYHLQIYGYNFSRFGLYWTFISYLEKKIIYASTRSSTVKLNHQRLYIYIYIPMYIVVVALATLKGKIQKKNNTCMHVGKNSKASNQYKYTVKSHNNKYRTLKKNNMCKQLKSDKKIFIRIGIQMLQVVTQILYKQEIYTLTHAVR